MAAGDLSDLQPDLKIIYDRDIKDLMPGEAILQKTNKFSTAQLSELGRSFNFPIMVRNEWGLSLNGSTGAVVSLASPQNGLLKEASVTPYEQVFRGYLAWVAATRGSSAGQKAFLKASALKMKNLMEQARRVTEIHMLHGQEGIATVKSLSSQTITLVAGSSAPALLSLLENAILYVMQSDNTTLRQKNLTVTAIDTSPTNGEYTITVSGTVTGIALNDIVYLQGCESSATPAPTSEMLGLGKLISTQTGDVWGVASGTYNLWRGNAESSFGRITAAKILDRQTKNINKGGSGEYTLIVPPVQFQSLVNDEATKQVFDSSYKPSEAEHGFESIRLRGPASNIVVMSHPFQKEGKFYLVQKENVKRVGSTDHTMEVAGQELARLVEGKNAVEFMNLTDQCIVLNAPAKNFVATGVTTT